MPSEQALLDPYGVREGLIRGLELPPEFTISQWADNNVILPASMAAEPGKFRTARAPFQGEIMDAMGDPDCHTIVWQASAQTGKSQCLLNAMGFYIQHAPAPMILVQPTIELAENFSKSKIQPLIDNTPSLRELVAQDKSRSGSNTMRRKEFPSGFLMISGANSPVGLRSMSVKIVFCDEIDAYPYSSGDEGDPIKLAQKRSLTFGDSKLICTSTPTLKGLSRINDMYEASDRRKWFVPCPHCNEFQVLEWERVQWDAGKPKTAKYCCCGCGVLLEDHEVKMAVRQGHWRALGEFNGIAGFWTNQLYSPWSSLEAIVTEFEEAKGKPNKLQTFYNTTLGMVYDGDEALNFDVETLMARREVYPKDHLPENVCAITAGIDIQSDRLEVGIIGHGPNDECWWLGYLKLYGDPSSNTPWNALDEVLAWKYKHPSGQELGIEGVAIDSGYLTQRALDYANKHFKAGRRYFAIKGVSGEGKVSWIQSKQKFKDGAKLFLVGVDALKTELYSRLTVKQPGENYIHIPKTEAFEEAFIEGLIAERVKTITNPRGFPERQWVKVEGARNEPLDLWVYAQAVLRSLNIDLKQRLEAMRAPPTKKFDPSEVGKLFRQ